jgi:3-dehydroquinate dehydratase II
LSGVGIPFVEVHISNVFARERERRRSALASAAVGVVCGLGTMGYELALRGLVARLSAR